MSDAIEQRLLRLTGELIAKGVSADKAAEIAKEMTLAEKPWLNPDEASERMNVSRKAVERMMRAGVFRGARKFGGLWRIPAVAVLPELKG